MIRPVIVCAMLCLYLGVQDGHLALMDGEDPAYIFPYRAELYTETDRALLQQGIPLPGDEDIAAALEDYFS